MEQLKNYEHYIDNKKDLRPFLWDVQRSLCMSLREMAKTIGISKPALLYFMKDAEMPGRGTGMPSDVRLSTVAKIYNFLVKVEDNKNSSCQETELPL